MRHYALSGHSERSEARQIDETPVNPFPADVEMPHGPCVNYYDRPCTICQGKLLRRERKVHRGECARMRKTVLQQRRRMRGGL